MPPIAFMSLLFGQRTGRKALFGLNRHQLPFHSHLTWPSRLKTTLTVHKASPEADREVPTPLLLLSANLWADKAFPKPVDHSTFISHFTTHGWQVLSLDLDPPNVTKEQDSTKRLELFSSDLSSHLQEKGKGIPFPPLLISSGLASLIAEYYVSSHPLSGLVLLNPPLTPQRGHVTNPEVLPSDLPDFSYEPRFPTLVAWTPSELDRLGKEGLAWWDAHRIELLQEEESGESLDKKIYSMDDQGEDGAASQIRKWAEEECGIVRERLHDGVKEEEEIKEEVEKENASDTRKDSFAKPDWFTAGSYSFNPSGSKKEPLLMDPKDLGETFVLGRGPGGQAINKLATCVQLKHEPTGILVRCQESRSRELNRELARRNLSQKLDELLRGKESVLAKERDRIKQRKIRKKKKLAKRKLDEGKPIRLRHRKLLGLDEEMIPASWKRGYKPDK